MDRSEEFKDTSFNFLMESHVSFDGSSPVGKDLLLVGEFKTGIDNVSIAVNMEWGEMNVLDLKLPCSHVILIDLSFVLKPLVNLLSSGSSLWSHLSVEINGVLGSGVFALNGDLECVVNVSKELRLSISNK